MNINIKYLFLAAGMFLGIDSYSQDIVSVMKDFYNTANMDCYIDKAQQRMMKEYDLRCKRLTDFYISYCKKYENNSSNISYCQKYLQHGDITGFPLPLPPNIDLNQSNTVPILNIQFVNTENYNYSDNIYNYITIDSVWMFSFAYVDKRMNVKAFVNYAAPHQLYWLEPCKKYLKGINKYKPDLILRCAALAGGIGNISDDGLMYIKDGKIYKYMEYNGKSYELNDFFRRDPCPDNIDCYLNLDNIRRYLNQSYIPLIYQKGGVSKRRTNNAPENEKMICPPIEK